MMDLSSTDQLHNELAALKRGEPRTWGQTSSFLNAYEQSQLWANEAGSFTKWLECHAKALGSTESTLWRYLTAGRYYQTLRPQLLARNVQAPPLDELPVKYSPECFELLGKLERIAPYHIFTNLADGLMQGTVTRSTLRSTWGTFRPILGGKTARGRDVAPPRFEPDDPVQYHGMFRSMLINTLFAVDATWLGGSEKDRHETFLQVGPLAASPPLKSFTIDAVVAVVHHPSKQLYFNGIAIFDIVRRSDIPKLEAQSLYCDMFWVAVPYYRGSDYASTIPAHIGIITVDNTNSAINVLRHARPIPEKNSKTGDLAKAIMLQTIKS